MDSISQLLHSLLTTEGLRELVVNGGYLALFLIIFSETGLLIGFFLPGDSLLVTTGILISNGAVPMNIFELNALLILAAVLGDATGYFIGRRAGHKLYSRPNSRWFKREHLMRTHAFYEKHGGKTIVFARFIPIVRTFAPVVAGAADMGYGKFATFNIIGGALWIILATTAGYLLGTIPGVEKCLHLVIAAVIVISLLPPIVEWLKHRREKKVAIDQ